MADVSQVAWAGSAVSDLDVMIAIAGAPEERLAHVRRLAAMATIRVRNASWTAARDYSTKATRDAIVKASYEQVRDEERTVVRRLMRRERVKES